MKFFAWSFFFKKPFPFSLLQLIGIQIVFETLFYFADKFQLISFFEWNFRSYDLIQEVILQVLIFFSVLTNYFLKISYQKTVMLFFSVIIGFFSIGYFIVYYFIIAAIPLLILHFGKGKHIRNILVFCLLYEGMLYINYNHFLHQPGYEKTFYLTSFFLILYPIRFVSFYRWWMKNPENLQKEMVDYYLYFFPSPYFIFFPFIMILPGYQYQKNSFFHLKFYTFQNDYSFFYYGILHYISAFVVAYIMKSEMILSSMGMTILDVFKAYFCFSSFANFLIGYFHLLGYRIKPTFDWPFLSSNLFEFFNRFMVYIKDFIMENFYLPIIIKLRFVQSPQLRMGIGLVCSLILGSVCIDLILLGMNFCIIFEPSLTNMNHLSSADMYVHHYYMFDNINSWQDIHIRVFSHLFGFFQFSFFVLVYAYCYKRVKSIVGTKYPTVQYVAGIILNTLIFITVWYFSS